MVKIRGKRKRPTSTRDAGLDRQPCNRGRRLKRAADLAPSRKAINPQLQKYHSQVQGRDIGADFANISPLERLPAELIQTIFFLSCEVSLPRASPYLARVLSDQPIYHALILFAYFDEDGVQPVERHHFRPAEYRRLSLSDKIHLQKGILDCRWCTLGRIRDCLPALSRLKMVQEWHREWKMEEQFQDQIRNGDDAPVVANPTLRDVARLPSLDVTSELERHFLAKSDFPRATVVGETAEAESLVDYDRYLTRILSWTSVVDSDGKLHKTTNDALTVLAARTIPDRLLRGGPWTMEKHDFLQLLRQGFRFLQEDCEINISYAAVFEGMASAIQERKPEVLRTLLELHTSVFDEHHHSESLYRTHHAQPTTHPIPLSLFHLAAQQESASSGLISLLIRQAVDSIPLDDRMMTSWTLRHSDKGDKVAKWLLRHMEGTQDYGMDGTGYLFVKGALSWRRAEGDYPFPEKTFLAEIDSNENQR